MPDIVSCPLPLVRVLGSAVTLVSVSETVDRIEEWINSGASSCHRITVSGFHGLLLADKAPILRMALNGSDLWVPDGIAPVLLARLSGCRNVHRTTGTDVMMEYFRRANEREYSSYFYGDTDTTLGALAQRLRRDYPNHRIAGAYAPPFRSLTQKEDAEVIARINEARPDVLWVALGMPKQELWIYERLDRLAVPVAIGVGAAFSFVAGTVPRCPDWMGSMGFEWAFRLTKEPKKLWRRVAIDGPAFMFRLALEAARLRRSDY